MVQSQRAGSSFEAGTVRVGLRETALWQNVTQSTKLSMERTEVKEGKKDENRHCLSSGVISQVVLGGNSGVTSQYINQCVILLVTWSEFSRTC